MHKIKEALWSDYDHVSGLLKGINVEDEKYQTILEERDKIRKEILEFEKLETERITNNIQIQSDNKKDGIRNAISVFTFIVSTGVSLYSIAKTFKFDQSATVTSTLGRNILNGVVPKMGKR